MNLTLDLTKLPPVVAQAVHRSCSEDAAKELVAALDRQRKIAKFYRDNIPFSADGIGHQDMAIDPYFVSYFEKQYGIHPLEDPDFKKWMLKRNEEFRVKSKGTRFQVGWSSITDCAKKVFSKVYPHSEK